jgi:hypothetical protein
LRWVSQVKLEFGKMGFGAEGILGVLGRDGEWEKKFVAAIDDETRYEKYF